MKKHLTIIGTLISICSFSQGKMNIDLYIAPLYGYRTISSSNSLWKEIMVDPLDSVERPSTGLSFGLFFEMQVSKRLTIKTGLESTALNEKVTRKFSRPTTGQIVTYSEDFYNSYKYLGMPLAATYSVISNSHLSIGVIASLRLDKMIQYDIEPYSVRKDNSLSVWVYDLFALGSSAALNFEYEVKKVSFYINPGFFIYLTPNAHYYYSDDLNYFSIPVDTEIKQHNYYFFSSLGVKYTINSQ